MGRPDGLVDARTTVRLAARAPGWRPAVCRLTDVAAAAMLRYAARALKVAISDAELRQDTLKRADTFTGAQSTGIASRTEDRSMWIRTLSTAECNEVLASERYAHLACAQDGRPYVVPIHCV